MVTAILGKQSKRDGCCLEHDAIKRVEKLMRAHPFGPWQARTVGVGAKQLGRLLGAIGDPAWNSHAEKPRSRRQLYQYCGYGDARTQVRRKGMGHMTWNPIARQRARMVADSCVKIIRKTCPKHEDVPFATHVDGCACSPYRLVFDAGREKYLDAVHDAPCVRCGPSGHPAEPGSPLNPGHQDGRARRLVVKAILRDLHDEALALHGWDHEETPDA